MERNTKIIQQKKEQRNERKDQELLEFRHGAVAIAKQANSKIVPFAIK